MFVCLNIYGLYGVSVMSKWIYSWYEVISGGIIKEFVKYMIINWLGVYVI